MKKMNDLMEGVKHAWAGLSVPVQAAVFSGVLALLRLAYDVKDGRRWYRKFLEASICISVTFGASSGLSALHIPESGAWLIAVALGWLGADWVREHGRHWSEQRINNRSEET